MLSNFTIWPHFVNRPIRTMRFSSPLLTVLALEVIGCSSAAEDLRTTRPNILLIVVDDLRDLGGLNAVTPTLDALSVRSTVFRRAYVQEALCAPSRNSFLTSRFLFNPHHFLNTLLVKPFTSMLLGDRTLQGSTTFTLIGAMSLATSPHCHSTSRRTATRRSPSARSSTRESPATSPTTLLIAGPCSRSIRVRRWQKSQIIQAIMSVTRNCVPFSRSIKTPPFAPMRMEPCTKIWHYILLRSQNVGTMTL